MPQIGTSNCVARYRTLSGGIGGSPTPTHSSDYVDDEEDDNDDMTDKTAVLNGASSSPAECSNAAAGGSIAKHLKAKQNNHVSHSSKASTISYQKASVHYVSEIPQRRALSVAKGTRFSVRVSFRKVFSVFTIT